MDTQQLLSLQEPPVLDAEGLLEQGVLQERQRLARELHDSVSQALYGIHLCARNARELLEGDPRQAIGQLEHVIRFAEQGMAEMQTLLFDLRADALQKEGLMVALSKQMAMLQSCYGLNVEMMPGAEPALALEVKHALYRIAQEALHNVVKHANARTVTVRLLARERSAMLEIGDDGKGFEPGRHSTGRFGLCSMQERAAALNGSCTIESAPGMGTCVRVRIPGGAEDDLLVVGKTVS